jgi:hypothetical protein
MQNMHLHHRYDARLENQIGFGAVNGVKIWAVSRKRVSAFETFDLPSQPCWVSTRGFF